MSIVKKPNVIPNLFYHRYNTKPTKPHIKISEQIEVYDINNNRSVESAVPVRVGAFFYDTSRTTGPIEKILNNITITDEYILKRIKNAIGIPGTIKTPEMIENGMSYIITYLEEKKAQIKDKKRKKTSISGSVFDETQMGWFLDKLIRRFTVFLEDYPKLKF